jgi:hypothetical protein
VTLPVVWIPEADADLREAEAWYEKIQSLVDYVSMERII